jgi:hypothetical protein
VRPDFKRRISIELEAYRRRSARWDGPPGPPPTPTSALVLACCRSVISQLPLLDHAATKFAGVRDGLGGLLDPISQVIVLVRKSLYPGMRTRVIAFPQDAVVLFTFSPRCRPRRCTKASDANHRSRPTVEPLRPYVRGHRTDTRSGNPPERNPPDHTIVCVVKHLADRTVTRIKATASSGACSIPPVLLLWVSFKGGG